jgi:hypothetical protein
MVKRKEEGRKKKGKIEREKRMKRETKIRAKV